MSTITIDERFHGPANSGNGGYSCGLVASQVTEPVTVALRSPPPLDTPMTIAEPDADGIIEVHAGETLVATATPGRVTHDTPPAQVDLSMAEDATSRYFGFHNDHVFPTCWVCGPERDEGDGLRIFPGAVPGAPADLVAAPWTPAEELDDGGGDVQTAHVWAALDCPSYFGLPDAPLAVLGSLAVTQHEPVRVGEPYVVLGWTAGSRQGRRIPAASALLASDGRLVASGAATWVELPPEVIARMAGRDGRSGTPRAPGS